jgi:hypothetical protein
MKKEVLAYLIEETNSKGDVVWKIISFFEPDEISWLRDLKKQAHNLTITELVAGNIKYIDGVKKYDSKRLVESNIGH